MWIKGSHSLHYYQIKLVRKIFGSKHHAIKIETHAPMLHPIRALCPGVLQHEVP